jgi:hypothetical protein
MSAIMRMWDREAKEHAERRAVAAEARESALALQVEGLGLRLGRAEAECERLASLWESKAAWLTERHREGSGAVARANAYRECAALARSALVSPSPRPAENEGNEAKENA